MTRSEQAKSMSESIQVEILDKSRVINENQSVNLKKLI